MTIESQFEARRHSVLREVTQIEAMIRDLTRSAARLQSDAVAEETRAGISDPHDTAYPILARVLTVRRENLKATIAALEQRVETLRQFFPETSDDAGWRARPHDLVRTGS